MNLLDPLRFDQPALAQRFALNHRCGLCLSNLVANGNGVNCPTCGPVYEHTAISIHTAETVNNDRRSMRQPQEKPMSVDQILKELYNE